MFVSTRFHRHTSYIPAPIPLIMERKTHPTLCLEALTRIYIRGVMDYNDGRFWNHDCQVWVDKRYKHITTLEELFKVILWEELR